MSDLVWMGHAGHFIRGRYCGFRLNTYINGYIVSTVGELKYHGDRDDAPDRPLGAGENSLYETMVFKAVRTKHKCCPWMQDSGSNIDGERYATSDAATEGHHSFIRKYAEKATS